MRYFCGVVEKPSPIFNFYEAIRMDPVRYRQLAFDELLITEYSCPLENRLQPIWSQCNYFVYVLEGKKVWHTREGAYEVTKDSCVFVRKGAAVVEQFFDAEFCVLLFFVPDEFICETLRPLAPRVLAPAPDASPVLPVEADSTLKAFFHSMLPYFARMQPPDKALLELKFRELLLNIAGNSKNRDVLAHFCSLLHEPTAATLRQIMEANFQYNLSLEAYAQLCNRSLSAFKRDFQKAYRTTPGKWLLAKRLAYARVLLQNPSKTVTEVAYESGFENLSHFSRAFRAHYGVTPAGSRLQPVL